MKKETTHTPEPWEFRVYSGGCTIVSKHDRPGSNSRDHLKGVEIWVDAHVDDDQGNAADASPDARRIVSCVNACAGLVDPEATIRDLVGVLEGVKEYIESAEVTIDGEWGSCRNLSELQEQEMMPELYARVNAALAKVKGGQP